METNKIGKVDKFFRLLFIKTYKSFFHLLGFAIFISQMWLFGFTELLTINENVVIPQLLIIAANYFMVTYLLERLGINKLVADEYKKINE